MNAERLLKLADHLENGKLFTPKFDITRWHCSTSGCAIGECPGLFPDEWRFDSGLPTLKGKFDPLGSAEDFFGLNGKQAEYLFLDKEYGDYEDDLANMITKKTVAKRIRDFVNANYLEVGTRDSVRRKNSE